MRNDIQFDPLQAIESYTASVERLAVTYSLVGQYEQPDAAVKALRGYVRMRRDWLTELREAGVEQLAGSKFTYARNCPPCANRAYPRGQQCHVRFCPDCFGRKVAAIFVAAQQAIVQLLAADIPFKVLGYREMYGKNTTVLQMHEREGSLDDAYAYAKQHNCGSWKRHRDSICPEPYFAYTLCCEEPVLTPDDPDEVMGYWRSITAGLFIGPAMNRPSDGRCWRMHSMTDQALVEVIGNVFQYPNRWFKGSVEMNAYLFNAMYYRNLFVRYGQGIPK